MARRHTLIVSLAALSLVAFTAGSALAASNTATAQVNILAALSVGSGSAMDFGDIMRSTSGDNTFTMDRADGSITDSGPGDGASYGTPSAAQFSVSGGNNAAVTVSAAITSNFSDGALTLGSLDYDTPGTLDGTGSATINVAGALTVGDAVALGSHNDAQVTLTVNYQ